MINEMQIPSGTADVDVQLFDELGHGVYGCWKYGNESCSRRGEIRGYGSNRPCLKDTKHVEEEERLREAISQIDFDTLSRTKAYRLVTQD